jgi:hypothetical protein
VTINGERFTGATSVRFGDVASPQVTVLSASQLRAKVPAGSAGTVAVTVESPAGSSVPRQGVTYTYLSPACAVPVTLSAINGRVELQGGGFISVQLQRRPGLFGLGRYWSGTVSGQLPIAGTTRLERFTSLGITSDNVAALLPGTCGGVSLRLSTINTSVFPWPIGSLRAELVPSGDGTAVTAKVGRASVVGASATGQLSLG